MRLIVLTLAVFVFAGRAAAQNRQEYNSPDHSFRVTFPVPQIETMTYQVSDEAMSRLM